MLGLIHSVLFEYVDSKEIPNGRAQVLGAAGIRVDSFFEMGATYPDDEFGRILGSACNVLGIDGFTLSNEFAVYFTDYVRRHFPGFFEKLSSPADLIRRQPRIHSALASGVADKAKKQEIADKFQVISDMENSLRVRYESPLRLCQLYRATASEVAKQMGSPMAVTTEQCFKSGGKPCIFELTWNGAMACEGVSCPR